MSVVIVHNHFDDCHAIYFNGELIQEYWNVDDVDYRLLGQTLPILQIKDIIVKTLTHECSEMLESDGSYPKHIGGLEFEQH